MNLGIELLSYQVDVTFFFLKKDQIVFSSYNNLYQFILHKGPLSGALIV